MPNTKYLLTLILCLATQFGWAQDDKPYFEGEIYRIQMSSGIGSEYKGKHELRTIYETNIYLTFVWEGILFNFLTRIVVSFIMMDRRKLQNIRWINFTTWGILMGLSV